MMKRIANWGNYPVIESNEEYFAFENQLHDILSGKESFIPRGNGRCYGDASLATAPPTVMNCVPGVTGRNHPAGIITSRI